MKVLVVYYSVYGHIHRMAEAVAEGAKEVKGVEVEMRRVPVSKCIQNQVHLPGNLYISVVSHLAFYYLYH